MIVSLVSPADAALVFAWGAAAVGVGLLFTRGPRLPRLAAASIEGPRPALGAPPHPVQDIHHIPPPARLTGGTTHMPEQPPDAPVLGDITTTSENPVLDLDNVVNVRAAAAGPDLDVVVNVSLARREDGERCIRVLGQTLTTAEAHELWRSLEPAVDGVGDLRQRMGFER